MTMVEIISAFVVGATGAVVVSVAWYALLTYISRT